MASDKEYLTFILDQLPQTGEISFRPMMGEYILYFRQRIFGGIYDNRFLIKPTKSALEMMPDAQKEIPYPGGKAMLLIDDPENRERMAELLEAMFPELPAR